MFLFLDHTWVSLLFDTLLLLTYISLNGSKVIPILRITVWITQKTHVKNGFWKNNIDTFLLGEHEIEIYKKRGSVEAIIFVAAPNLLLLSE